jgi:tRNA(Ile)-lysidine synthase
VSTRTKDGPGEPDALAARLRAVLDGWKSSQSPPRITVAFSGGLDSTVLLSTLCRVEATVPIRAAHVDHGLNPRSADWSEHCARAAAAHGVEFAGVRVASRAQ